MKGVTFFVYYDWEKPHSVIRTEKPFTKEMELLEMLSKGKIVGFDIVRIEYIYGKRIKSTTEYRLQCDCNAVMQTPF